LSFVTPRILIALLLLCFRAVLRAQTDDFAIDWFTIDGGGGTSADDVYSVTGTIGQPDAGGLSDDLYSVTGGFWAVPYETQTTPSIPTRLSITRTGGKVILTWPEEATGYFLEQSLDYSRAKTWATMHSPVVLSNGLNVVTISNPSRRGAFFRLTQTPTPLALSVTEVGGNYLVTWPATAEDVFLEQNFDATQVNGWAVSRHPIIVSNALSTVVIPVSNTTFFRLTTSPTPLILKIERTNANVVVSWPAAATGYYLEQNPDIAQTNGWSYVGLSAAYSNGRSVVTMLASDTMLYYRLNLNPAPPRFKVAATTTNTVISWAAPSTGYFLERTADPSLATGWLFVTNPVVVVSGQNTVTVPPAGGPTFYRLTLTPHGPPLNIRPTDLNSVLISWSAPLSAGYGLQRSIGSVTTNWLDITNTPILVGQTNQLTFPSTNSSGFFRLRFR
jgi:hypothetical protein